MEKQNNFLSRQKSVLSYYQQFQKPDYDLERELTSLLASCMKPDFVLKDIMTDLSSFIDLYTILGYTRDIHHGLGQRMLFYRQLLVWYNFHPILTFKAIEWCVFHTDKSMPYGSWRDLRDISMYVYDITQQEDHPLIIYCIELFVYQLITDSISETPSLAAKWCPRERNKYKWLFRKIAKRYAMLLDYISKPSEANTLVYFTFRNLVSSISKRLNTIESCDKPNYALCSARSLQKHMPVLSKKKEFITYVMKSKELPSAGLDYYHFIRDALKYKHLKPNSVERVRLHKQWISFIKNSKYMGNTMIFLDMGRTMEEDQNKTLYHSVGLALHLAHCTNRFRIMVYATQPTWVHIGNTIDFTDMVQRLFQTKWGNESNLKFAIQNTLFCGDKSTDTPEYNKMTFICITNRFDDSCVSLFPSPENRPRIVCIGDTSNHIEVQSIIGYQIQTIYRALLNHSSNKERNEVTPVTAYQQFRKIVRDAYIYMELQVYDELFSSGTHC
jgi:hypothetical protein